MTRFPSGYGFPFQYYHPYYYSKAKMNQYYNTQNYQNSHSQPQSNICQPHQVTEPVQYNQVQQTNNQKHKKPNDVVWLDLFGIKLYFDDVLILGLLYFLYNEEVKDEGLFLALIMLLIS